MANPTQCLQNVQLTFSNNPIHNIALDLNLPTEVLKLQRTENCTDGCMRGHSLASELLVNDETILLISSVSLDN